MVSKERNTPTEEMLEALLREQKKVKTISEWRQLQAIWLRESLHMSGPQVAKILNYRLQTVHFLWHRWIHQGIKIFTDKKSRGGRHNAYMTVEEEGNFLRPFSQEIEEGSIPTIEKIKEAFENRVGEMVPKSTIYRLLHRHGWSKDLLHKKDH